MGEFPTHFIFLVPLFTLVIVFSAITQRRLDGGWIESLPVPLILGIGSIVLYLIFHGMNLSEVVQWLPWFAFACALYDFIQPYIMSYWDEAGDGVHK